MIQTTFVCRYVGISSGYHLGHLMLENSSDTNYPSGTISLYTKELFFHNNKKYKVTIEELDE